jgi:hypothetical protein
MLSVEVMPVAMLLLLLLLQQHQRRRLRKLGLVAKQLSLTRVYGCHTWAAGDVCVASGSQGM